jgi:hypothetical protein
MQVAHMLLNTMHGNSYLVLPQIHACQLVQIYHRWPNQPTHHMHAQPMPSSLYLAIPSKLYIM